MDWNATGAVGDVVGGLGVVITLLSVTVQVRHARLEVQRSISESRAQTGRDLLMTRATTERLGGLYVKAGTALATPPIRPAFVTAPVERAGLTVEAAAALYWDRLAWRQYRLQVSPDVDQLPPVPRTECESRVRASYGRQPLARLFHQIAKRTLDPAAVHCVDELLARSA